MKTRLLRRKSTLLKKARNTEAREETSEERRIDTPESPVNTARERTRSLRRKKR